MSLGTEQSTTTPWLIGGALALFAASTVSALEFFVGTFYLLLPGDGMGLGGLGSYVGTMLEATWPYLIADLVLASAAGSFLRVAHRNGQSAAWGPIAVRALVLLTPAVAFMTLIVYLINQFPLGSGAAGFTF